MRQSILQILASALLLYGQPVTGPDNEVMLRILAGARAASLLVKVTASPEPGDRIVFSSSSSRLKVTLMTPSGLRVAGEDGGTTPNDLPLGATDAGFRGHIALKPEWKAGNYTLTFASPGLPQATVVSATYVNDREYWRNNEQLNRQPLPPEALQPMLTVVDRPERCFAGERLKLKIQFLTRLPDGVNGGVIQSPLRSPVQFEVHAETRARLPGRAGQPYVSGAPVVSLVPVTFTLDADGSYLGLLPPAQVGTLRLKIDARGLTREGQPFASEDFHTSVTVEPLVATLAALVDRAVDSDGNGRPDHLEIQLRLNVIQPGNYSAGFIVNGPAGDSLAGQKQQVLRAGPQTLKVILPAAELFEKLKDGPYRLSNFRVDRVNGDHADAVKNLPLFFTTAAYRRDAWDRGPAFGEERVKVAPILPAPSGKHRALEFTWVASTKGGVCEWTGRAEWVNAKGSTLWSETVRYSGKLPPGSQPLAFVVNTRRLAQATTGSGTFRGTLDCDGQSHVESEVPFATDLSRLEPQSSPLRVSAWKAITVLAGATGYQNNDASLAIDGPQPSHIQFRILEAAPGLNAQLRPWSGPDKVISYSLAVFPAVDFPSGRYFVTVEGRGYGSVANTEVEVNVLPALPPTPTNPSRAYLSGPVTVKGIRPDSDGKFQYLDITWPVRTPGGTCNWGGSLLREGTIGAAVTNVSGFLPPGHTSLSLVTSSSVMADSGLGDWTFHGYASCHLPGQPPEKRDLGAVAQTKLDLNAAHFAKSGALRTSADPVIRLYPGEAGKTMLFALIEPPPQAATFRTANIPVGFTAQVIPDHTPGMPFAAFRVTVSAAVVPGRYFLGFAAKLGQREGFGDVLVEVVGRKK